MEFGTAHFVDMDSAISYYKMFIHYSFKDRYGKAKRDVERKLKEGEIKIGPPKCRHDETYFIKWSEGRYFKKVEN